MHNLTNRMLLFYINRTLNLTAAGEPIMCFNKIRGLEADYSNTPWNGNSKHRHLQMEREGACTVENFEPGSTAEALVCSRSQFKRNLSSSYTKFYTKLVNIVPTGY